MRRIVFFRGISCIFTVKLASHIDFVAHYRGKILIFSLAITNNKGQFEKYVRPCCPFLFMLFIVCCRVNVIK